MKYVVDIAGELPKTGALRNAKEASVMDLIEHIAGELCDGYCKFPELCKTEVELWEKHCATCPLRML